MCWEDSPGPTPRAARSEIRGYPLYVRIAIVLAVALCELGALAGPPGVAELVVSQRSLQVAVLPAPAKARGSSLGHLLDGDLVVPAASVDSCGMVFDYSDFPWENLSMISYSGWLAPCSIPVPQSRPGDPH